MHLGNGAITPECALLTLGAAAVGLAGAAVVVRREPLDRRRLTTAGTLCAALYAAQMVNVPVLPFSSAHLVGGVLLAWSLGPALGALTMAVVLAIQALLLGDGGLIAWGANVINMGLLPAGLVWFGRRHLQAAQSTWQKALTVGTLSVVSVLLAALLIVVEVGLFRNAAELSGLVPFAREMLALHAWIGLAEGFATCAILLALGGLAQPAALRLDGWRLAGTTVASLVLSLALLPLASRLPDGYEAAALAGGLSSMLMEGGIRFGWQESLQAGLEKALVNEQLVALTTTCLAGLLACGLALACRFRLVLARVEKRDLPRRGN